MRGRLENFASFQKIIYTTAKQLNGEGTMLRNLVVLGFAIVALSAIAIAINGCGSSAATSTTTNPTLTINGASS